MLSLHVAYDVERSFSLYKYILTVRKTNITVEHMEQYIIVNLYCQLVIRYFIPFP